MGDADWTTLMPMCRWIGAECGRLAASSEALTWLLLIFGFGVVALALRGLRPIAGAKDPVGRR